MTKKVYQNCKYHDPGAGFLMLRCVHMSHYSEYALSSTLSIYNTLIALVLWYYNAAFLCNSLFFSILLWGC